MLFCIFTILSATSREYLGDVNQDGEIDVLDIVRIVNIILENDPPPTEYELWASDVNVDESTDVIDIIIIVQVIIGNDDCPYLYSQCSDNFSDCCVDTTSHFVELQIDTLGVVGGFSSLSDVAIINENNIWVVGEIRTEETNQFDSTGTWVNAHNAAHWNGNEWELLTIVPEPYSWGYFTSIYAFDENNIWLGGSIKVHWNGTDYIPYGSQEDFPSGMGYPRKIWGYEENVIFIFDNAGIVHYDGETFEQMESGTEVNLKSISGTGMDNIWVSGKDLDIGITEHTLLHYDGEQWNTIISGNPIWEEIPGMISGVIGGVYTDQPDSVIIVTHLGFYKASVSTLGEGINLFPSADWQGSIKSVAGVIGNDIFFGGGGGALWHFNGETVHSYSELLIDDTIVGIGCDQSIVGTVGSIYNTQQVFVLRGIR